MLPSDPLDDETIEAFLSGRTRPGDLTGPLAAFAQEVDAVAGGPPPSPKGDLAALLRDGFSPSGATDRATAWTPAPAPVPADRTTSLPEAWVPVPRKWVATPPPTPAVASGRFRARSRKLIPSLAGLGIAAKVGLGLGVAAASVTGAGVAGVLPDPAQHVVATVFDTVTPFQLPDPGPGRSNRDGPRGGTVGNVGGPGSGSIGNGVTGDVEGPGGVGGGSGVGPSADGSTGLDRAGETPAAGNVPPAVPVPTTTVSPGQKGLDRAGETPAAGNVPPAVPAPGLPGLRGLDRAGDTPAADRLPTTTSTTTTSVP